MARFLPFPIALKNCVLSAFRQNNAPQLRLYQNWGANMAKDSNFDTMHPLIEQGVHFCFVGKLSLMFDKWWGCNFMIRLQSFPHTALCKWKQGFRLKESNFQLKA